MIAEYRSARGSQGGSVMKGNFYRHPLVERVRKETYLLDTF
jgi:hypothetical protein